MENIIIGFAGKKQSGKTTAVNIIKEKFKDRVIILNFGDAVKESLRPIFHFTDEELYGDKKEVINEFWGITPRNIMQFFATELMRQQISDKYKNIGGNIWVLSLEYQIKQITDKNKIILIGDLRFKNEYDMIKKYNGLTVRINKNIKDNEFSNHISEHDLDNSDFDYEIENNESMETYKTKIIDLISKIIK